MSYIFESDGNYVNFNGGSNLWRLHKDSNCIAWHWDETGDLFFDVYDQQYQVKAENIGTVVIGGVTLTTAADFATNIVLVFTGLSSGSGGAVLSATVEVTDAQFKNLDSVGITLIDAPGAGKAVMVTSWAISKLFAAGAYGGTGAGANGLQMYIEGTGDIISREITIVASDASDEFYGGINTGPSGAPYNWFNSVVENKAVELWSNLSNDMTGGNAANTLKVTVYYVVVDL